MDSKKRYLIVIVIIVVLAAALTFFFLRREGRKTNIELPQGGTAEVTPVENMKDYNAENTSPIDIATYTLRVYGLVERPLSLSYDDILNMQADERLVTLHCVEGWTENGLWKGVLLKDLLNTAGVKDGADNVIFSSPGGYTTSLTMEDIEKTDPILAYQVNDGKLPDSLGSPLRLVVPNKYGYKWIKWVTEIQVIQGEYQGYWESRGYSNSADVK
jgi:DMSO/TMAO reductase YedYZ molybdopterin-dependent catalytic subunit